MNWEDLFYPGLLMCLLLGIMVAAIFVSVTFWMRQVDNEYRKCPQCGEKGAGYIARSDVIESKSYVDHKAWRRKQITLEKIEDHYQCEKCGHTWTVLFEHATRSEPQSPSSPS
jgi:transposase